VIGQSLLDVGDNDLPRVVVEAHSQPTIGAFAQVVQHRFFRHDEVAEANHAQGHCMEVSFAPLFRDAVPELVGQRLGQRLHRDVPKVSFAGLFRGVGPTRHATSLAAPPAYFRLPSSEPRASVTYAAKALQSVEVSTVEEVLERFRKDVVAGLEADGFKPPAEAQIPGNCYQAVAAWVRLQHRGVTPTPRIVRTSRELLQHDLDPVTRSSLEAVQVEFEHGVPLTHRLTRQFYKAGFNDFLFNAFGIQHLHLGAPAGALDKTKQHVMSGSGDTLLFAIIGEEEAYFLDVLDHDVFDSPEKTKWLVRVALRNWPSVLQPYIVPNVVSSELSFEGAFRLKKSGFTVLFDVDGVFFAPGNVLDGKVTSGVRVACTSTEVVDATNRILNRIVELVEFIRSETGASAPPGQTEVRLEVIQGGSAAIIRDQVSGAQYLHDGQLCSILR